MSEMGFETVFYLENFDCAGDEVLVESSPPPSPGMAARLAGPAQGAGAGAGGTSPSAVRELIVIPEIPNSIHLQHAIHQVSSNVVEVNGDSSGHSSPTAETQHTYITVSSEAGNGVNYHVQYVEPQEIYTQNHQQHLEPLRTYPVYSVTTVAGAADAAAPEWPAAAEFTAYHEVAADEAETPASPAQPARSPVQPPRMPPATVQWLLDKYETAEGVSLPRSTLYAHYLRHCTAHRLDPVNAASFGKLIRSVFIGLRTRRLGTRGNSKYHYYGIRAKANADSPPRDMGEDKGEMSDQQEPRARSPETETEAAVEAHRQYLGARAAPEPAPLHVELPPDVPRSALDALREHHRAHGVEFLEAVSALDTSAVERARRSFWRRSAADSGGLCRRTLWRLAARRDVAQWLKNADLQLYQTAVDLLMPDVLRPIPPQLTQAIRNFAKSLEGALSAGSSGAPAAAAAAQASAAAALAAALRRYTSLNHLAQAARAVLNNQLQIQQMLADLNRVDFRVVREQAAWACSCGSSSTAHRLEVDFKATLGRGATLEQWASWLERCVSGALAPHAARADFTARARRLLLDWSFYSSLVIRELTLRSAASFGSFHLLRLLYDEYVSYVIERRVAAHRAAPPIAVMHAQQDCELSEDNGGGPEEDDNEWEWEDDDDDSDEPGPDKKPRADS
ncbi:transcription factor RFX3 isoform X2 [Plodia interpunctella]|uniref:transcription factor RFX3 isoform X2 n=1 Tax=Plodia interpunctella TaxID=58824 RepID=UPI002367430B|nr:transcription factor RFX3 isoform X2 [Plodia interpunctella]